MNDLPSLLGTCRGQHLQGHPRTGRDRDAVSVYEEERRRGGREGERRSRKRKDKKELETEEMRPCSS